MIKIVVKMAETKKANNEVTVKFRGKSNKVIRKIELKWPKQKYK